MTAKSAMRADGRPRAATRDGGWTRSLVRNLALWLAPVFLVWLLLTPYYNLFLRVAGQNLLRLTESPDVTTLLRHDRHYVVISRGDFPAESARVSSVRLTDLHFHLVLLAGLFLATPDESWRRRLAGLGSSALIFAFFHLLLLFFWVKFHYSTQLGSWSLEHYGAVARNVYGLGKHLLDIPFKLALPFLAWAFFHLGKLERT